MTARAWLTACAGAALTLATPGWAAQETAQPAEAASTDPVPGDRLGTADELAAVSEMLSDTYKVEPLTPEQEARLPAARAIIARIVPEGSLVDLGKRMFDDMLGPLMQSPGLGSGANAALGKGLGVMGYGLTLDDDEATALAGLFDPAWQERQRREMALIPDMMAELMGVMEPGMRKVMSELYAIKFDSAELAAIDAFFATEAGSRYARESFAMSSDPRIMGASLEMLPVLMGSFGDIEKRMAASTADLPPPRSFADLTPAEKARVAAAIGYSVEEIEANLEESLETATAPAPPVEASD